MSVIPYPFLSTFLHHHHPFPITLFFHWISVLYLNSNLQKQHSILILEKLRLDPFMELANDKVFDFLILFFVKVVVLVSLPYEVEDMSVTLASYVSCSQAAEAVLFVYLCLIGFLTCGVDTVCCLCKIAFHYWQDLILWSYQPTAFLRPSPSSYLLPALKTHHPASYSI